MRSPSSPLPLRAGPVARVGLPVFAALLAACTGDEPVVSGTRPHRTEEEVREAREKQEKLADPSAIVASYQKKEGVYVDVAFFGGKEYAAVRDQIEQQLGALVAQSDMPEGQGQELRFERATLRRLHDRIYMMSVPLPEALHRSDALTALGFPSMVPREYVVTTREYRANQVWGFRRLRFMRVDATSELVDQVEAWKMDISDL